MPAQTTRMRKRILLPLALALLLLEAVFLFFFHYQQQEQMQERLDRDLVSAQQTLQAILARQGQILSLALDNLTQDPELARRFLARDRPGLTTRAAALLEPLRRDHGVNSLTFADPHRVAFLRAHNPQLHGDRLDRHVIMQALSFGKTAMGLDLGPWGFLSLRAARVWSLEGETAGLLETGTEIKGLIHELNRQLGLDFLVVVDKALLERENWESGMTLLGRAPQWDLYPHSVAVEYTLPHLPPELGPFLEESRHQHGSSSLRFGWGGRSYRAGFVLLADAGGRRLGDLVVLREVTALERQANTAILVVTLVCLGAGLGLTLLFSAFLGHLEHSLAQAQGRVLELERDRSRFILESLPAHIALVDGQGRLTQWGVRSEEIFGYPSGEILGKMTVWDLFQDPEEAREAQRRLAQQGRLQMEAQGRRAGGQAFWMRFSLTPLPGSPSGEDLLNLVEDITARKAAEEARQNSMERFRVLSERSPLGICLLDARGVYQYLNPAFLRMFGYARQAIPDGRAWLRLVFPDAQYRHRIIATWKEDMSQLAEGETRPRVFQATCADGSLKTVLFRPVALRGGGSLVIYEDMTDRMNAERALRESEQRYRRLFESAHDGIFIMRDERFIDCNPRIPEMFGCFRDEILGKTPWEFSPPIQPNGKSSHREALAKVSAAVAGKPQFFQWRHLRLDGRPFDAEVSLASLEIAGRPHLLAVVRDITERLQAEEALRRSEEKLFKAFRRSPLWVAISTVEEGRYLDVNDTFCQMTGYSREEVVGRTVSELGIWVDPEDREKALTIIHNQGFLRDFPTSYFRRPSGEERQALWSAEVIEVGGQDCLISVVTDITDALASQQALAESEQRHRLLTDHSLTGVYIHQGGRFIYVNRRLAEIMGEPSEGILSRNFWEFVHPEDRDIVKQRGVARSRGETVEPANYAFRVLRPDGSVRWLEVLATTIELANGPANIGNVMDITERREAEERRGEAEEALRKSEARNRAVLEAGPDPMVVYDMDGNVTFFNPAFTRVFGWTLEERLGRKLDDFVPEVAWPETRGMIAKALAGEGFSGVETRRLSKAGEIIPVSISGAVFPGPDGHPQGALSIIRDIRESKRMQSELFQSKKMEVIGTLASGIAHDFNNILGAVVGYAERAVEMAKRRQDNTFQLDHILRASERAGKLVRQILAFSRKEEVELKPLDMNRQVEQAVSLLGHTIPKMVRIETKLDPALKSVNADAGQMDQVLLNLATNAVDAMPNGGRLLIETENISLSEADCRRRLELQAGEYVLIIVSDTGHGMDEQTRQHIFDPFFTTKEVGKGTGLGLSTVYGIVKNLGGHVSCYSEPGLGTAIKIYLPPTQTDADDDLARPASPAAMPGGHERILLADDEEDLRELAAYTLREMGYSVVTAKNGEEALEIYQVRGKDLDLVILDLGMPGMGGQKCLERILAIDPQAKVLIASGYSVNGQVAESMAAGAADFVAKPFRLAQLLTKVRQVLDRASASPPKSGSR